MTLKINYVIFSCIWLLLLASSCTDKSLCKNIVQSSELTFGMSYCQGDMCSVSCSNGSCHDIRTKNECESVDVVSEKSIDSFAQDGKPDCKWNTKAAPFCRPNK
ncbi:MAG: hypothetical protein V1859_09740 [archaeon]